MPAADDLPTHARYYEEQIGVAWNTTTPTSGGLTQVIRPVSIASAEAFGKPTVTVGPPPSCHRYTLTEDGRLIRLI